MRSSKSRSRSKSNRPRPMGNIVNRVFDSSGPEGKVRGTPQQIIDKYLILARDAQLSNDRVNAENFLQHAEHYTRMLSEAQREMAREQESRRENQQEQFRDRQQRRDQQPDNGQDSADEAAPVEHVVEAPAPVAVRPTDVIEFDDGEESSLVETPESRRPPVERTAPVEHRPAEPAQVAQPAPVVEASVEAPAEAPVHVAEETKEKRARKPRGEDAVPRTSQRRRAAPRKPKGESASQPGEASVAE